MIAYRLIQPEETHAACELVAAVFDRYNAPALTEEGIAEFRRYNNPEAMTRRSENHFSMVATTDRRIVGIIEMRNRRHISLLYVLREFQGMGIARALWTLAFRKCREEDPAPLEFTVSSSDYATAVYEKFGFRRTAESKIVNGLRFVPMTLNPPSLDGKAR